MAHGSITHAQQGRAVHLPAELPMDLAQQLFPSVLAFKHFSIETFAHSSVLFLSLLENTILATFIN
jgi:hypothetical protein